MKTAFISGSSGFVAGHLWPILEANGYRAFGCDKPAHYITPPSRDFVWMSRAHSIVVHLAANIDSIDKRVAGGANEFSDCEIDLAMMRYIEKYPPQMYVHMTSCAVTHPAPNDPYCAVKTFGEAMAQHVCRKASIPLLLFRPYSGYGEGQSESYPVPAIVARALRGEDPLTVWGALNTVRDFIHISDIVRAIMLGIEGKLPLWEPIELGTGRGTTMLDLARIIAAEVGYNPSVVADTSKPAGARSRVMESDQETAIFQPQVTLEDGIRRVVAAKRRQLEAGRLI